MSSDLTIGVDIGGTKMAFVVADRNGTVQDEKTLPTPAGVTFTETVDRIAILLNHYLDAYKSICGIGIGLPGPVDAQRGIALHAANLGWERVPIREAITSRLAKSAPVYIANDVNAGAIGEQRYGVAKGIANFVYLTVGTGVGGAVMIDNRLMRGASASEMEIGHVSLDPVNGRQCTCGQRGCLEMSISGKAILAHASEHLASCADSCLSFETLSTHEIIRAAERNDPLASHVLEVAAEALGIGCAWCINLFNPKVLILGGGLIHATWHLLKPHTLSVLRARSLALNFEAATVSLSQLVNGALGASALVWYHRNEELNT